MNRNALHFAIFLLASVSIVAGCDCKKASGIGKSYGELLLVYPNPENPDTKSSGREAVYDFGAVFMEQTKQDKIVIQNYGQGTLMLEKMEYVSGVKGKIGEDVVGEKP